MLRRGPVGWIGLVLFCAGLLWLAAPLGARAEGGFVDSGIELPGVGEGSLAWADYDNDGDPDLALAGVTEDGTRLSRIYRNDAGAFHDIEAGFPGAWRGVWAWGDYDNDADLDVVLSGWWNDPRDMSAVLYRNDEDEFVRIDQNIGIWVYGTAAWGDLDSDGDLDLLQTDENSTRIWINIDSYVAWVDLVAPYASGSWPADYDSDGDLDIILGGSGVTRIYRNDVDDFRSIGVPFGYGLNMSFVAWGDYDQDGDPDLAITGYDQGGVTSIFRNDDGVFTDIHANLAIVGEACMAWGDYDNDGDLDLALMGVADEWQPTTRIYRNDAGVFTDIEAGLPGVGWGSLAWGDYDGDSDLDLAINGVAADNSRLTRLYRNDIAVPNAPPSAPTGLGASSQDRTVILSWDAATDDHTPALGLTYNLRVGTTPGGCEITAPMAGVDGQRRLPAIGNTQYGVTATLTLPTGTYYWSVQAIDAAYAGGAFSEEGQFTIQAATELTLTDGRDAWRADQDWDYTIQITRVATSIAYHTVVSSLGHLNQVITCSEPFAYYGAWAVVNLGDLAPGATRIFTMTVRAYEHEPVLIIHHARLKSDGEKPITVYDRTWLEEPPPTPIPTVPPAPTNPPAPPLPPAPPATITRTPSVTPTATTTPTVTRTPTRTRTRTATPRRLLLPILMKRARR